jgi:hypothetical protein
MIVPKANRHSPFTLSVRVGMNLSVDSLPKKFLRPNDPSLEKDLFPPLISHK